MTEAWVVKNDRICIIQDDGTTTYPTANEIFSAAFQSSSTDETQRIPSILHTLSWLNFSRFSADPAVRFSGSLVSGITLEFGVSVEKKFIPTSLEQDQVIFEGQWYPIDLESMHELKEITTRLGIQHLENIAYGQVIRLKQALSDCAVIFDDVVTDPKLFPLTPSGKYSSFGIKAELYPYQKDGIAFLKAVASQGLGCILADEMGLGKTLQVIAILQSETRANKQPCLVIAPATLLENWRREVAAFAPDISTIVHIGRSRTGDPKAFLAANLVITSYDLATRDEVLLNAVCWNVLVLDEAQAIKNHSALRTASVKRINRRVSIAVTGTPVENSLSDLWSISDFALEGLLGDQAKFNSNFSNTVSDAATLGAIVAPLILRRTVAEVATDLPSRIDILQPIRMSEPLALLYEDIRTQILAEFGESGALVATTRLRMLCTHPKIASVWSDDPAKEMPKYERLVELLEEIFSRNEKALIFTSFTAMSDLLISDLKKRFVQGEFYNIDGRVPTGDRQHLVDKFSSCQRYGALVLNPKAAGTGLNITSANHVIHYNPEWNPALTSQATARAYRRKQQRPVTVHYLYFADTVEDIMMSRAEFKSMLANEISIEAEMSSREKSLNALALAVSPTTNGDIL